MYYINLITKMNLVIILSVLPVICAKYTNINYNLFTIIHVNHTLDTIINYTYNDIDNNKLDINHHHNVYSMFTQSYFNNCDKNSKLCEYNLYDQERACQIAIKNEGGQIYYHGSYTDELVNYEIESNGNFREIHRINRIYTIKGMYILLDLINETNSKCITDNLISKLKYTAEPPNFNRKMMLYLHIDALNYTSFCPIWEFNSNC